MKWSRVWPWNWLPGKVAPVRRAPILRTVRLAPDILEDRVVPSTTALDDAAHQLWAAQTFTVDDMPAVVDATTATPQNSSFGPLIGLPSAFANYPYRGNGYSVVVIDTGIDYTHADLGAGFGVGHRVIAGWDFVNNDADPIDDNGHGTHVAGIIGGASATYSGVAPNVNLIALKVLNANGSGTFGAVESALQWVVANRARYNIVAVNLSLGTGNYTVSPYTYLDDEFSTLKTGGVFTTVAAGNGFYTFNSIPGLDFPAVTPYVVSVGAVWSGDFGAITWASGARDFSTAADRIASFTQRGAGLSIMAPGALVTSTHLGGVYRSMAGTSMAAPVIAGAAAILHQAMDARGLTANQDTILSVMKSTGVTVVDGDDENDNVVNTGLSFKRLDLGAALGSIGGATPNAAPVLQPLSMQTVLPGGAVTVTLNATDANDDAITYSARVLDGSQLAVELRTQLGLKYAGTYYQNNWGQNEKWMSSTGGVWYCILPNGQLRRWSGSMTTTLQAINLIATLDVKYHIDPSLLWNAQAPSAANTPTLSIVGNQLNVQTATTLAGAYQIEVTASDGKLTSVQTFTLIVTTNTAPRLNAVPAQSMLGGRTLSIVLSATDDQKDPLTYSATIVGSFATPPAGLVVIGNQLTIHASPDFVGSFDVRVTASDGSLSSAVTCRVTVGAPPAAYRLKGDFDGDGRQDTAIFNQDGSWWLSLARADGAYTNQRWGLWSAAANWRSVMTGDCNGDGKSDVIGFSHGGAWFVGLSTGSALNTRLWTQWSAASNWKTISIGDFNGDGKTEIAGFGNTGSWWVGVSTGAAFSTKLWTQWSAASNWSSIQFRDVDGDGKLDIIGLHNLTSKWYVGYATGTSFRVQLL